MSRSENPSAMLLLGRPAGVSGITVLCTVEGTRFLYWLRCRRLVSKTSISASTQNDETGFDYSRLCVLLAVLEKRTGYNFGGCDVYINVIGGSLKWTEPAPATLRLLLLFIRDFGDIPIGDRLGG